MPVRSSVMFLGPRQRVSVEQLLKGLVVDSGNDAAVQLARRIGGNVPAFVRMMNEESARLGFRTMRFVDPSGISWKNRTSAREYAEFCRLFVRQHPEALQELCSLRQFTYPLPENRTAGNRERSITQVQSQRAAGALRRGGRAEDGLHRRVRVQHRGHGGAVGNPADRGDPGRAPPRPARDFRRPAAARPRPSGCWTTATTTSSQVRPPRAELPAARVWKGRSRTVDLALEADPFVLVRKDQAAGVCCLLRREIPIVAPVKKGQVLGEYVLTVGSEEVGRIPLYASARGAQRRTRAPGPRRRLPVAENEKPPGIGGLSTNIDVCFYGASEGNRTLGTSLGSLGITIIRRSPVSVREARSALPAAPMTTV